MTTTSMFNFYVKIKLREILNTKKITLQIHLSLMFGPKTPLITSLYLNRHQMCLLQ